MRNIFVQVLIELAMRDDAVVFITGDLGFEFNQFRDKFPNRYFNFGVCEQSMISAAAGMALMGLKPVVYSITPFLLERPFEQVKIDLDQQKAKVMLVGYADYPTMGPTHAELDWQMIGKMLKNTSCFFPKNDEDARIMLLEAYECPGPAIISLKKPKPAIQSAHYICTGGCRGVSQKPGTCQAETCSKHTMPLITCSCSDGQHGNFAQTK